MIVILYILNLYFWENIKTVIRLIQEYIGYKAISCSFIWFCSNYETYMEQWKTLKHDNILKSGAGKNPTTVLSEKTWRKILTWKRLQKWNNNKVITCL